MSCPSPSKSIWKLSQTNGFSTSPKYSIGKRRGTGEKGPDGPGPASYDVTLKKERIGGKIATRLNYDASAINSKNSPGPAVYSVSSGANYVRATSPKFSMRVKTPMAEDKKGLGMPGPAEYFPAAESPAMPFPKAPKFTIGEKLKLGGLVDKSAADVPGPADYVPPSMDFKENQRDPLPCSMKIKLGEPAPPQSPGPGNYALRSPNFEAAKRDPLCITMKRKLPVPIIMKGEEEISGITEEAAAE